MSKKPIWVDLGYYGMRWFVAPRAEGAPFVIAAGKTEESGTALSSLGFRRHPTRGYWVRKGMPAAAALRGKFPQARTYEVDDPASIILKVEEPARAVPDDAGEVSSWRPGEKSTNDYLYHAGRLLYRIEVRGRGVMWAVESADNKARRLAGEAGRGGGDSLLPTLDEAKAVAELEDRQETERQAHHARIAAEEAARKAEQAARKADTLGGFLDGVAPMQAERIRQVLDKQYRFSDGGVMSRRERVEALHAAGTLTIGTIEEQVIKPMSRTRFNRASNGEQHAHARRMEAAGTKTVYLVADSDLGKVAYDYAAHLLGQATAEDTHTNEAENEQGSEHEEPTSADPPGSADEPVPEDQADDGSAERPASDVAGTPAADEAGDGSGARTGRRQRTTLRSDDDALIFGAAEPAAGRENYRLPDGALIHSSFNAHARAEANLAAIRVLRRLGEGASLDEGDPETLIEYAGWGGLPQVFSKGHSLSRAYGEQLQELLGDEGFAAARASTVNAHYTAVPVVDAVWRAVQRAGFTGGRVLEPGAGTGLFLARVPEEVADKTRFVAVEKDATTGAILTALYPRARVHVAGFEETPIPNHSMDLVIGNVPFGDYRVYDAGYKRLKAPIHDYFLVKSLDKLRPGGVLACITSSYTLDKQNSRLREAMYERADLVAACRLPDDAFAANANTRVTTDVLFMRKRKEGEEPQPFDWRDLVEREADDGSTQFINGIYSTERGRLLGSAVSSPDMYGGLQNTVSRRDPKTGERLSMESVLARLGDAVPAGIWAPEAVGAARGAPVAEVLDDGAGGEFAADQEGNYVLSGKRLGQVVNGQVKAVRLRFAADEARVRAWIPVRDAAKEVLRLQLAGCSDSDLGAAQEHLNAVYDSAVRVHGPVSTRPNRRVMADDPDLDILLAAEDFDEESGLATKTEVFHERTLGSSEAVPSLTDPSDALMWCVDTYATVDPERIAEVTGASWDTCRDALRGKVFRDPATGEWEIAAKYLSGNVRAKLRTAERAAQGNGEFDENVAALRARLPIQLTASEIDVELGQPWIPIGVVVEFVNSLYDGARVNAQVSHNTVTADWTVTVEKWATAPRWATDRFGAADLVELALRGQAPKAYDKNEEGNRTINAVETAIAIERQKEIRAEFSRWVWQDEARTTELVEIYNERFRSRRSPDYSGMMVTVPGMATTRSLRSHQMRGVVRVVMEPNTLLAHPVGFGKTATMVAAAMKLKALEAANKSMIVVRKNTLYQAAAEAKRWFPTCRVLMVRSEDLNPKGRAAFWRRVQTRNPDIILVTPEAYKRIQVPRDAEIAYMNEELALFERAMHASESSEGKNTKEVKRLEKARLRAKEKLARLINAEEKDDRRVTLDALGVDALFVDEAQNYKNLQVVVRERMLGIPTAAAQRATDMHMKVWWMQSEGKKVVFATGTPVVNTLAEIYNLQRYLSPELLEEGNLSSFDAWLAQFGAAVASIEPDPGGSGFRTVTRLAEVRNVPDLVAMFAQVTDAVAEGDVQFVRPTPRFSTVTAVPTEMQALYRKVLTERVQEIRERSGWQSVKGEDNVLAVLGDSRRAALDLRTLYPGLSDAASGNKLGEVVARTAQIHRESTERLGTQLIFLDLGTPGKGPWNAYDTIRDGLAKEGVPREEVAFIHECKTDQAKADLFKKVRAGKVRVLIGSTEKMGEGTNVQDRLVALHHVNAPFHPGAVIQRNGRAIRQGNMNTRVEIVTYVTQGLLEDWNWHLVTLKERFIAQLMDGIARNTDGEGLARRLVEDASASMSFEEIEAMASGDPLVKEKCGVDAEVKRLRMLQDGYGSTQAAMRRKLASANETLTYAAAKLSVAESLASAVSTPPEGELGITVGGKAFTGERAITRAGEALLDAMTVAAKMPWRSHKIGEACGLTIMMVPGGSGQRMELVDTEAAASGYGTGLFRVEVTQNPVAMVKRIEMTLREVQAYPAVLVERMAHAKEAVAKYERELGEPWTHAGRYAELLTKQSELNIELERRNAESKTGTDGGVSARAMFESKLIAWGAAPMPEPDETPSAEIDWTEDDSPEDDDERPGEDDAVSMAASMR